MYQPFDLPTELELVSNFVVTPLLVIDVHLLL